MSKTVVKNLFAVILLTVTLLFINAISVSAAETVASGECGVNGDNVTWELDSEGTLTVCGEGEMRYDFLNSRYKDSIIKVVICNGITKIGGYAFRGCTVLNNIVIPDSVTWISCC